MSVLKDVNQLSFAVLSSITKEDKDFLLKGAALALNAPPVIALSATIAAFVQWNLEHIAVKTTVIGGRKVYNFQRLSTHDTSNLKDKNLTPLSPPLLSLGARVGDLAVDTGEHAAALAQSMIETHRQKGLIGDVISFIFGEK